MEQEIDRVMELCSADILDGFTDVSEGLRGGVYVLLSRGVPVFVGRADRIMLAKIVTHRANARSHTPSWFPIKGVVFDQVLVRYVHPDRLDAIYDSLLSTLRPPRNAAPAQSSLAANR